MRPAKIKTIVWVHSHFLYWMGGTKFIYEVVKRIKTDTNYKIIVVVEATSELVKKQYQEIGVELLSLESATSTSLGYWLFLPWVLRQRRHQLKILFLKKRLTFDNTSVITSMFPMNVVMQHNSMKHIQLCYEPFAFFYDAEFVAHFPLFKRWFIWLLSVLYSGLDKKAVQDADQVVTLNQVTREQVTKTYGVQSTLCYAGVDAQRFKPFVSAALRKKYTGRPVAIHSTDYSPVKGTDRVIKAMRQVIAKVPKAVLIVTSTIQNPQAEKTLSDLAASLGISKNVEFVGFLPIKQLPQYYSLASVLVQGSNSAKSGTTSMALPVKEAMCCGTPAIRPDIGGEDVVDGVSGFLVDPSDTSLLAEKMIILLKNKLLSHKMGRAARKSIAKRYTWSNTMKRIVKYV